MLSKAVLTLSLILISALSEAKEIALTFDDAPVVDSKHFESQTRTNQLILNLKALNVPPVMIFANPCKREDHASVTKQLKRYKEAGHIIANHTCSHPRLDEVGFAKYSQDTQQADQLLSSLYSGQKFFRFPYLNEGKDEKTRDQMREWLAKNQYRNGMVSIDTDDHIFSYKINQAKGLGKKVDYSKVEKLFLDHVIESANFYDDLAVKSLGYSPKHVLLLHEVDATVMFVDSLVKELRKQGWKIISAEEAYQDKLYLLQPKNTYAGNGIIAQVAFEKTGQKAGYFKFDEVKAELNKILGLQ